MPLAALTKDAGVQNVAHLVNYTTSQVTSNAVIMACHILYGRPYCNDAKEGVGAITPPKLNRGG